MIARPRLCSRASATSARPAPIPSGSTRGTVPPGPGSPAASTQPAPTRPVGPPSPATLLLQGDGVAVVDDPAFSAGWASATPSRLTIPPGSSAGNPAAGARRRPRTAPARHPWRARADGSAPGTCPAGPSPGLLRATAGRTASSARQVDLVGRTAQVLDQRLDQAVGEIGAAAHRGLHGGEVPRAMPGRAGTPQATRNPRGCRAAGTGSCCGSRSGRHGDSQTSFRRGARA